jgi:hypothetical protein
MRHSGTFRQNPIPAGSDFNNDTFASFASSREFNASIDTVKDDLAATSVTLTVEWFWCLLNQDKISSHTANLRNSRRSMALNPSLGSKAHKTQNVSAFS